MEQLTAHLMFDWTKASFEEAEAEVCQWGDKLGQRMDARIVPVVVGLNLSGIRTISSCEGHLDHGFAYPWVMFERSVCPCYAAEWQTCEDALDSPDLDAYHAADKLLEAKEHCLHRPAEALKLGGVLASFYATPIEPLAHLTIEYTGTTFYRLIPLVADGLKEGKANTLARCQAEMARFASFLKVRCKARMEEHPRFSSGKP